LIPPEVDFLILSPLVVTLPVILLVKIIFLVVIFQTIATVLVAVVLLPLLVLFPVYLRVRQFQDSEQQLHILSCQGSYLGLQCYYSVWLVRLYDRLQMGSSQSNCLAMGTRVHCHDK
jgi:hypothetical protein